MKILFLSSLCSTPLQPGRSPGNARILRHLRRVADCLAIVPVPWYPRWLSNVRPTLKEGLQVPEVEADEDGAMVFHPRTYHIPGIARCLHAGMYAISVMARFKAEVERFQPDVVLSACAFPDGTAAVALGAWLGLPVVVRTMGSDINISAQQLGRRSQVRWALRRAGRVIAVSRALGAAIERLGVPPSQVAVVPTGVETAVFHPHDRAAARAALGLDSGPVVVVAARLSPEKGLLQLLRAVAQIQDPRLRLLLVGDGPQRSQLQDEAERLQASARVRFEGFQPEARLALYYSAADLVCLPSRCEGWPDTLMESFACGCPVVASSVGGVPDIVALTGAGILVPPGEAEALAKALRRGLATEWDRPAIARAMLSHTISATAGRYLELCEQAATERKTRYGRATG